MTAAARAAAAVTSGLAIAAAFPPRAWWGLAWIALVPLWVALAGMSVRHAFALGWLTGAVAQAGILGWVVTTLGDFSTLPLPVAWLVFALLAVVVGLPMGVFAAGLRASAQRGRGGPVVGAAWFVVTEWFGAWLPAQHTWGVFGATQQGALAVAQVAEVAGVFGLSALLVVANGAIAEALASPPALRRARRRPWRWSRAWWESSRPAGRHACGRWTPGRRRPRSGSACSTR